MTTTTTMTTREEVPAGHFRENAARRQQERSLEECSWQAAQNDPVDSPEAKAGVAEVNPAETAVLSTPSRYLFAASAHLPQQSCEQPQRREERQKLRNDREGSPVAKVVTLKVGRGARQGPATLPHCL